MYEKYPISGIKQSYRHTGSSRTVILPLLMTALIAAMAVFYIKGRPADAVEKEAIIVSAAAEDPLDETPKENSKEVTIEAIAPSPEESEPAVEEVILPDSAPSESASPKTAEAATEPIGEKGFTPWMEPLALDSYIRAKSSGNGKSFWENGHWITSVEGRWKDGAQEFRITYEKIPEIETWQWRYRVNQSQSEFAASVNEMVKQGYTLVQTQTFREPRGEQRYQGVWHRQLPRPTVVDTAPTTESIPTPAPQNIEQAVLPSSRVTAESASERRGLNVNRLNFR